MIDVPDWMTANLTGVKKANSDNMAATCPYCGRIGKFYVSIKTGAWVCFSGKCEVRGKRIWTLVAKVEGISEEQARSEAFRGGVSFRRRKATPKTLAQRLAALRGEGVSEVDDRVRAELPEEFIPVYSKVRDKKWRMPSYMKNRGFTRDTMRQFGCGFTKSGVWIEIPGTDRSLNVGQRLLIPVVSPAGYSWTARDLTDHQKPKYLNAPDADHRRLIFGWDQVELGSDVALQEGPTDVMMSHQNGMPALGLMGKVLNREQLTILFKKPRACSIVIMLDPEAAADAETIGLQLRCYFENIYIAQLPVKIDPGKADRETLWDAYDRAPRFKGNRAKGLSARMRRISP